MNRIIILDNMISDLGKKSSIQHQCQNVLWGLTLYIQTGLCGFDEKMS